MLILGLTGKTGAGKSTVASYLAKKGCFIIDGDVVAREIVTPSSPALSELCEAFGKEIILFDGSLDRKKLAEKAFSSRENTELLNRITHPHIKKRFSQLIEKAEMEGYEVVLIDAAALLESDCRELCEKIIVVHAPLEIRLGRILKRDKITKQQALSRINGQKEDDYYLRNADYVINNDGTAQSLEKELDKLKELIP